MPLGLKDYFEQMQEEHSNLPFSSRKQETKPPPKRLHPHLSAALLSTKATDLQGFRATSESPRIKGKEHMWHH